METEGWHRKVPAFFAVLTPLMADGVGRSSIIVAGGICRVVFFIFGCGL